MSCVSEKNIVSDIYLAAEVQDANIVNAWGLVEKDGVIYVADNGSNLITSYNYKGKPTTLALAIASPTGLAYNCNDASFIIMNGSNIGPSKLIIVTENGQIGAYNGDVSPTIIIVISNANQVYKGVTIIGNYLYVCNFSSGFIEKYDSTFNFVSQFTDASLSSIKYAPFNIKNIEENLFVTYALQDPLKHDDVKGIGNGFVDIFYPDGTLKNRLINRGALNSPWGMTYNNDTLYVGNFGDGKIHLYDIESGKILTTLYDDNENDIIIDGLWSIKLIKKHSKTEILFTAGIDSENHGLLGKLKFE